MFASLASGIYSAYLHPLSNYPGPRIAGATRLWFCYHLICGDLHLAIHQLHLKYGEVVRIAPDELSYTHADGWNQIYGQRPGKLEIAKDPLFYGTLSSGPGSIVSSPRDRHAVLRKQMAPGFSERAMREQEAIIRSYADLLINALMQNGEARVADLVRWYNVSISKFPCTGAVRYAHSLNGNIIVFHLRRNGSSGLRRTLRLFEMHRLPPMGWTDLRCYAVERLHPIVQFLAVAHTPDSKVHSQGDAASPT